MDLYQYLTSLRMNDPNYRDVHFAAKLGIGSGYLTAMKSKKAPIRKRIAKMLEEMSGGKLKADDLMREHLNIPRSQPFDDERAWEMKGGK